MTRATPDEPMERLGDFLRRASQGTGQVMQPSAPGSTRMSSAVADRASALRERTQALAMDEFWGSREGGARYRADIERRWKHYALARIDQCGRDQWRSFVRARASGRGLYAYGAAGSGKTHLLVAVYDRLCRRDWLRYRDGRFAEAQWIVSPWSCTLVNYLNLLNHLKEDFGRDFPEYIEHYSTVDVLLIDDLGTGRATAWQAEQLYRIVNARVNRGLVTHYASNYDPVIELPRKLVSDGDPELVRDGDRIASRIAGNSIVVHLGGPDRRLM